ncbi:peptide-methionine (R)-S-oxide reductase MsrB [Cohaesibacter celericrescens]|uniref:peptide-methionine (R)-S-oxide reductase n=1 Tax=Cohaesibacter celericrescens TaxID=2067669 RepID=A0A2N5XR63_9HYPH|nr:peptide-methionine (R)-S-oxide reductase MsrB [Cohaesibacter celericrescens]PLW76989.1 peptide-methionine (R)-S-oxide reductase [Cohaesibacter celericrescens]
MVKIEKSEDEWKALLSEEQYRILRKHGTERAGSSALNNEKRAGKYFCAACGNLLYQSDTKYESGSGWPSFYAPARADAVSEHVDRKLFTKRTEIRCAKCDSHTGHVFDDGPTPTGLRYCMNGVALRFEADET